MNFRRLCCGLTLCALIPVCSHSVGVRNLRLSDLVNASDIIAIADVTDVKATGVAQPIPFRDQLLRGEAYYASLAVLRTIKGEIPDRVTVRFALPVSFAGYKGLRQGTRLVFLRRDHDNYSLADPYYPDLPAIAQPSSATTDHASAVLHEMLAVLASPTTSFEDKSEILRVDYALPHTNDVIAAFREALSSAAEPDFRQRLQGELIYFGDIHELPSVAQLLLSNLATKSQKGWLLYAIGNHVSDRRAVSALEPLLRSSDESIREAAVEALWHIADPASIPILANCLTDADEQVRFYAVRAFSDIANETDWGGPGEFEFHQHQQKYLSHWQQWAKSARQ